MTATVAKIPDPLTVLRPHAIRARRGVAPMRHPNSVRPELHPSMKRQHKTVCSRGHEMTGYNARPTGAGGSPECRACATSNAWASRNNLFRDNPLVAEHANRLIEQYRDRAVTP